MITPIIARTPFFEDLVAKCDLLIHTYQAGFLIDSEIRDDIREALNKIFEEKECTNVVFTNNTDNVSFGIVVNPTITNVELMTILLDDKPFSLERYSIEIDSKIVSKLTGLQLASYIVEDVASIMSPEIVETLRDNISAYMAYTNSYIDIQNSVNYSQIIIFGVKDSLLKIGGLLYKDITTIGGSKFVKAFEINESLLHVVNILRTSNMDTHTDVEGSKMSILPWVFMIYKELNVNYRCATSTLCDAIDYTGSVMIKDEIDKTIKAINRASAEIVSESSLTLETLNEKGSFLANLKKNGLRQIEDDLYEFKVRSKNCETQDEAIYIIRQINTRISIIDDYVTNTELSDNEHEHWLSLIDDFRELREEIGKRKISNKKSYGIFVDYDKLSSGE